MPAVSGCGRRTAGKAYGRKGLARREAVTAAVLNTTLGYKEKEEDPMYNESGDVLILAGLDPEKMEYLPAAERKRLLESAGLDPREFDF